MAKGDKRNAVLDSGPAEVVPPARVPSPRMGYLRDPDDSRDFPASAKFGAPRNLPSSALGLKAHVRRINDQQQSESCTGQAIQKAVDTRLRCLGIPNLPEPSALAPYTFGRKAGSSKDSALEDVGCYPRDVMTACRDLGMPSEAEWPFDMRKVNVEPPWDVIQAATKFLMFRWWRITASGSSRSDQVANALVQNYPVIFGLELDEAFMDYRGGTIKGPLGAGVGGHMLCILGYRSGVDGLREFLIVNSWGESWGEGGFCWIHENVICSDRATDLYCVEVSP